MVPEKSKEIIEKFFYLNFANAPLLQHKNCLSPTRRTKYFQSFQKIYAVKSKFGPMSQFTANVTEVRPLA